MGGIIAYWLIGCVVIGAAAGAHESICPSNKISITEKVLSVAIWPAILIEVMRIDKPDDWPLAACPNKETPNGNG